MKRIAILVETSLASGRQILTGISKFLDEGSDWSAYQCLGSLGAMNTELIRNWEGDGIIARIDNEELLEMIQRKGVPTVDVLGNVAQEQFPLVKCNDRAIGSAVAKHFIENAHYNFAYIGLSNERWSLEREEGFRQVIHAQGNEVSTFHFEQRQMEKIFTGNEFDDLRKWLVSLNTPVAIMVASDQFAQLIFETCQQLDLAIPEDVCVVGVDNDRPFSNLCRPRLSSVEPDHVQIGYLAAKTLDSMISNKQPDQRVIEIDTYTLHRRQSSELIALDDASIVQALKYIRLHASESPSINTIAEVSGLSRTILQRRFRDKIGRTVGDTVLSEKLRLAREMLKHTNLPLSIVAERSGFNSQEYMNHIFKTHLKTTPRKYRLQG
ncbi:MAG: substrate-binding domain-containing protein [Opitutaceae bacterium]